MLPERTFDELIDSIKEHIPQGVKMTRMEDFVKSTLPEFNEEDRKHAVMYAYKLLESLKSKQLEYAFKIAKALNDESSVPFDEADMSDIIFSGIVCGILVGRLTGEFPPASLMKQYLVPMKS